MNYFLKKAFTEIITAAVTIILLTGNLVSCSRKPDPEKPSSTPNNITYSENNSSAHGNTTYPGNTSSASGNTIYMKNISSNTGKVIYWEDTVTYAEETYIFEEDIITYEEDMIAYEEGMITYEEDMITYIEELSYYIEDMVTYEFGGNIDDMFFVVLRNHDYIDEQTVIYNPENHKQLKLAPILAKLAIGALVIIACVAITVATGGTGAVTIPSLLTLAVPYVESALAGAAFGAAIGGSISLIASGGDMEEFLYGAIEGAADGFMWGAVLSPGAVKLASLQLGKVTAPIKQTARYKNFSRIARESARIARNRVKDISNTFNEFLRPVLRSEVTRQIIKDIEYYTGFEGYAVINAALRNNTKKPAIRALAERISKFLKSRPQIKNSNLFRGENIPLKDLGARYKGLENVAGKSMGEMANTINNTVKNGKNIQTAADAFTSTSTEMKNTLGFATRGGNPKPRSVNVVREIQIGNKGVTGANVTNLSTFPKELEVILDTNLRTKVIGAYTKMEYYELTKEWYEVLHIIEQAL